MSKTVEWDVDEVLRGLNNLEKKFSHKDVMGLTMLMQTVATKMENYAKKNAVWTDRSGRARQGLMGRAYWETPNILIAAVMHQVDYGVWLELANEKKYAILEKTIDAHTTDLYDAVKILLQK